MRAWVAQVQDASTVTQLLRASGSNREALDGLFSILYDELRRVAHRQLLGQPRDATLNTTALIHEAYLRMVDQTQVDWEDRARFFSYAARTMRAIIVDYARRRGAQKRGGRLARLPFDDSDLPIDVQADAILAVDDALTRLARVSDRLSQIVECRFFGGLSLEETAAALGVSDRTVRRDWVKAKAWLYDDLCAEKTGDQRVGSEDPC
jgi:RNA polymerase sigma factor (TIGR02999 family)